MNVTVEDIKDYEYEVGESIMEIDAPGGYLFDNHVEFAKELTEEVFGKGIVCEDSEDFIIALEEHKVDYDIFIVVLSSTINEHNLSAEFFGTSEIEQGF